MSDRLYRALEQGETNLRAAGETFVFPHQIDDLCTPDRRISEYFAALRAHSLWPFYTPSSAEAWGMGGREIGRRELAMAKMADWGPHEPCPKGRECPLSIEMQNLKGRVAAVIRSNRGLSLYGDRSL